MIKSKLLLVCFSTLIFSCRFPTFSTARARVKMIGRCCANISAVTLKTSCIPDRQEEESVGNDNELSLLPAYIWNAKMIIR